MFSIPLTPRALLIVPYLILAFICSRMSSPSKEIVFASVVALHLFVRHLIKLGRAARREEERRAEGANRLPPSALTDS